MRPVEWRDLPLIEIAERFVNGGTPDTRVFEYWGGKIPWITSADIISFRVSKGRKEITQAGVDHSSTNLVPENTVLFVTRVGVGKVGVSANPLCFSQDITGIVCKSFVHPEYLARYLSSIQNRLVYRVRGSTIKGLSRKDFSDIMVPIPPLSTQRKIVAIINHSERLKELRLKTIQMSNRVLQNVFSSMFDTANFPKEPIAKHVSSIQLKNPRKKPDDYFKYIDIAGIDNKIGKIIEIKTILGKDAPSRARKEIKKEDVIVSTVRPNLNATALVPAELDNQICSTGFAVLRSKSSLNPIYLYAFTRQREFVKALIAKMKGASYPAVTDKDVLSVEIRVPPIEIQNKFAFIATKSELMRDRQSTSLQEITELFDSIMYKAFKGELVQ